MSLISNAKWNAFSQLFKISIQLINLIYLAKIIPPNEYGLMAMAAVVITLGILLRDLGTSAALIQRKILSEALKNTVFWMNTLMGLIIAIIVSMSAPFIADIYNQEKLTYVLIMISVTFPLSSCAAAHLALMERESQFKKISSIEISSSLLSVLVAVFLAHKGYGVYSLVGQSITLSLVSAIQFWYCSSWRPSFKNMIAMSELKEIFNFSANLSLFNLINYFSRNADSFIIGKFMSAAILGNYNLAYRIMLFPLQSLTFVASRSLYPVLSRQQDGNDLVLNTYTNCVFVIVLITAPLMTGLALLSVPFINIIFGPQWFLTADVLKWLAPTAIIQSVLSTTGSVFSAKGRTDILFKLGVVGTILQLGSFIIGMNFSITTFAMCYLIANILNFFPVMICLLNLISGSFVSFINTLMPIVFSTLSMIIVLEIFNVYIYPFNSISGLSFLILYAFIGAFFYFIFLYILSIKFRNFFSKTNKR
ncbi:lipopolysaccharide biosynthesis protein [Tatumella punctata]|uniref:Lipopolysaccharide biosynthesis protein n=1 Tax=Tatumella punctata TaxID=399969 RepID=A0ABW1VTR1_9GAMM